MIVEATPVHAPPLSWLERPGFLEATAPAPARRVELPAPARAMDVVVCRVPGCGRYAPRRGRTAGYCLEHRKAA